MKTEYYSKNLSDNEVVTFFPDSARECLPRNIRKWEKLIARRKKEILNLIKKVNRYDTDDFTKEFCKLVIKMYRMPEIIKYTNILFHQKIQWSLLNPSPKNNWVSNFQSQIEIAKEFPIYELARNSLELLPAGVNYKALCPFHDERHASFYIFPATNTFKCFSCGKGGDIINLTMALHGISFIEAVQMLNKNSGK